MDDLSPVDRHLGGLTEGTTDRTTTMDDARCVDTNLIVQEVFDEWSKCCHFTILVPLSDSLAVPRLLNLRTLYG